MLRTFLIIALMLLSACSLPQPDSARADQALKIYAMVRDGDLDALRSQSTPLLRPKLTTEIFDYLRGPTLPGEPAASKVTEWKTSIRNGVSTYEVEQVLDYSQAEVTLKTVFERQKDGSWLVDGIQIFRPESEDADPSSAPLET